MKVIRYFKLSSGEEFMGEIVSEDEEMINISNPCILVQHPQDHDKALLQPWGPLQYIDSSDVSLKRTMLATRPMELKPELEKLYISATSRIAIASPGMLSEIHNKR